MCKYFGTWCKHINKVLVKKCFDIIYERGLYTETPGTDVAQYEATTSKLINNIFNSINGQIHICDDVLQRTKS